MPLLLFRYILRDLFRVVMLTTAVLVSVIAFGAAIRPLAEDQILGPGKIAVYIILATVPMLQFALPFAAGFASTITFHRMTSDNEFVAIAASGISYRKVLFPVILLGLILTGVMVFLTQSMIPKFWGFMEAAITRDVTEIFQRKIDNGQPVAIGKMLIYADKIIPMKNPSDTGAQSRLILIGVVAAELDDEGRMVTDITAPQAAIDIYRRQDTTYIKLLMTDTVVYKKDTGELMRMKIVEPDAVAIPSVMRSQARTMTRRQLLDLRTHPEGYANIQTLKVNLADALIDDEIWSEINRRLRNSGRIIFRDTVIPDRRYVITADGIKDGRFHFSDDRSIELVQEDGYFTSRRYLGNHVTLRRMPEMFTSTPRFELLLFDVEVTVFSPSDDEPATNFRKRITLNTISIDIIASEKLAEMPLKSVLERARSHHQENESIGSIVHDLDVTMQRLQWEISARLLKRYALSVTAALLLVLGSVLAMWLKNSQPLIIYLLAFMPSVLDLILISGGEQMMRDGNITIGKIVMWTGNTILLGIIFITFKRLARH